MPNSNVPEVTDRNWENDFRQKRTEVHVFNTLLRRDPLLFD